MSVGLTARRYAWELSKWRLLRLPLEAYRHRGITPNDVYIASYPRSGSTWLRFMLCDILCDVESGFDVVNQSIPDIGRHTRGPALLQHGGRLIKTHERYRPAYRKAVYLTRDVRDVVISEHRHQQMEGMFSGDFDTFLKRFVTGWANAFARWDHHVNSWLDSPIQASGNLLSMRFEEMRQDPASGLKQVLAFLNLPIDESRIQRAIERNDLRHMQEKEKNAPQGPGTSFSNGIRFVSQGKVRGWREKLNNDQIELLMKHFGNTLQRLGHNTQPRTQEAKANLRQEDS